LSASKPFSCCNTAVPKKSEAAATQGYRDEKKRDIPDISVIAVSASCTKKKNSTSQQVWGRWKCQFIQLMFTDHVIQNIN